METRTKPAVCPSSCLILSHTQITPCGIFVGCAHPGRLRGGRLQLVASPGGGEGHLSGAFWISFFFPCVCVCFFRAGQTPTGGKVVLFLRSLFWRGWGVYQQTRETERERERLCANDFCPMAADAFGRYGNPQPKLMELRLTPVGGFHRYEWLRFP